MSIIRQKTKHLIYSGMAGAGVIGLIFAGYAIVHQQELSELKSSFERQYNREVARLKEETDRKTVQGWAPSRDIPAGHRMSTEDIKPVELPADSVPADYLKSQKEIAGKITKIKLRPFTLLTENLLYEAEPTPDDLRWREMSFIQLPGGLKPKDVIDVRIQFPTGQDYILLSKKKVEELISGKVKVSLNEGEILSLSSAIVDAYLHKALIYALTYVEPYLQGKAIPTYPASEAVLRLIKKDPNMVMRAELALTASSREVLESNLLNLSPQQTAAFTDKQIAEAPPEVSPSSADSFKLDSP